MGDGATSRTSHRSCPARRRELRGEQTLLLGHLRGPRDPKGLTGEDHFQYDELFVSTPASKAASGQLTGRVHLAFAAKDRETVDRVHAAGLAAGGKDGGKPGERPYHPGYYAAFLTDPDGNNIEAVFHGPAKWSAASVKITF